MAIVRAGRFTAAVCRVLDRFVIIDASIPAQPQLIFRRFDDRPRLDAVRLFFGVERFDQGAAPTAKQEMTCTSSPEIVRLFGISLHRVRLNEAILLLQGWMAEGLPCRYVVTPNVDHVVKLQSLPAMQAAYQAASLVVADGWPLVAASRWLGQPLPERVAGSDLVPELLTAGNQMPGFRVFLLGGEPGVGERAADRIASRWPHVSVAGISSPPPGFEEDMAETEQVINTINRTAPPSAGGGTWCSQTGDLAVAACGSNPCSGSHCGRRDDRLSGRRTNTHPRWIQRLRLEWLFRLASDPRRLAGRYAQDAIVFPRLVVSEWRRLRSQIDGQSRTSRATLLGLRSCNAIGNLKPRYCRFRTARTAPEAHHAKIDWNRAIEFLAMVAQLVLLALLVDRYKLESPAFFHLTLLAFGGFVVQYFLPLNLRMPFFAALSLASIVLILDWQSSAWLIGIGLVLIAVCHLPVAFSIRITIIAAMVALIAAARVGRIPLPVPVAVWPILASMFMFRLIVYLYHLRFNTAPSTVASRLSYFFMLPNVCFPLFPVVDYLPFVRGFYDEDRNKIHAVGVRWIFRGFLHLMLYRIIYKEWGISLYEVANLGDLVHYCLWLFLLYLRVSGQFHVIVGMLHLFGFNLPETHKLYFLASSFTDFWRRINIYWKDFIMKIFFYPMFFRLKERGQVVALVLSTLVAFFFTWLLHSLQWFWLRGSFLFVGHDILFWIILASLVIVNTLWELKFGRKRTLAATHVSNRAAFIVASKRWQRSAQSASSGRCGRANRSRPGKHCGSLP